MPDGQNLGQVAAQYKVQAAVLHQEDHRDKGQRGAAHGVGQVFLAGKTALAVHFVHDQGQGAQGQQLVEQIQGKSVGRKGDAQHHAVGHGKESKEPVFAVLVAHVLKAVQHRQGPQHRQNGGKHNAQAVQTQGQLHVAHVQHHRGAGRTVPQQHRHQNAGGTGEQLHVHFPLLGILRGQHEHRRTAQDRQQHRQ